MITDQVRHSGTDFFCVVFLDFRPMLGVERRAIRHNGHVNNEHLAEAIDHKIRLTQAH
jgi:hypothetical protein